MEQGEKRPEHGSVLAWKGLAAWVKPAVRIPVLLALVVCVVALTITQLGLFRMGVDSGLPVGFLHLTIVPVAVTALLFGSVPGAAMGLLAGAVTYGHAALLPANYYEQAYIGPLEAVIPYFVAGALFGLASALIDRHAKGDVARAVAMFASTLVCVMAFNALFYSLVLARLGAAALLFDLDVIAGLPAGTYLTAPIEASIIFVTGYALDRIVRGMQRHYSDRKLSHVFQGWLLLVAIVVFMVMGSAQFVGVSLSKHDDATEQMKSEIAYIDRQLNAHDNDPATVLDGYDMAADGMLTVVRDGAVAASNDPSSAPGMTLNELFGIDFDNDPSFGEEALADLIEHGGVQATWQFEDGHTELCYLIAASAGDYGILISWPLSKIYADRPVTLAWTTLAIFVTLAAAFLLATFLLGRIVVRRIDETNVTLGRITEGDLSARVDIRDSHEFSSLSKGINATVGALKDAIAEAEQRNAQELMTAKAIQESSLPRDFPAFPEIDRFDIYASMKTAKEVGGDFYDFFLIDDDRLGFVMADVSGKGIPAALFMMTAKTQVQTYLESGIPVGEAIEAANHQLCLGNDAGMFVTLFACVLEFETGRLAYVNAGHNPPLVLHAGTWEWMRDVSGMPLGLFDGTAYGQFERQLETGDMLYLYTDGVTEAMDKDGALFGEERLKETLGQYRDMNPRSASVGVRRAITDFTEDCEQSDDITMLCLKYGVPPESKAVMILPADVTQLVHVFNYVHAELHRRGAPKSVLNPIDIAAEELFVNVCHYAYPDATPENPGEVRISFEYSPNPPSLTVEIADDGVPYDPLAKPDAVTPDDIAEVPIGGLGILMAKNSVDDMSYRREGGSNILTFRKEW